MRANARHATTRLPGGMVRWRRAVAVTAALVLAALLAAPVAAEPIRRLGQTARGIANGGTGISYSNDVSGLYYNPAGLGAIDNWWVELLPLTVEASQDALDLAQDDDLTNLDDPADLVDEFVGKEVYLRTLFNPNGIFNVLPGLTLGVSPFAEAEASLEIRNKATPEMTVDYRNDQGSVLGASVPVGGGKVIFGANYKQVSRTAFSGELSSADIAVASAKGELAFDDFIEETKGTGTGFDLGMIVRMETLPALRPQYALAVQNVGGIDLGDAGTLEEDWSTGFAVQPEITPLVDLMVALEWRDLATNLGDDTSRGKRTHLGIEVGVIPFDVSSHLVSVRAGYNGGSPSYGVELALWRSFSLQYVRYSQEYGDTAGQDPRERQMIMINFIGF